MRTFGEYVQDHRLNSLYYGVREYAKPDYFMSFTEAKWESAKAGKTTPVGIYAWKILETLDWWQDSPGGKVFSQVKEPQESVFILKTTSPGEDYTNEMFLEDVQRLRVDYDFKPNKKLIRNLEKNKLFEDAEREKNKFKSMVLEATAHLKEPDDMLWEVTMWLAAGNRNPHQNFPDNAPQRWNNIIRKLGYSSLDEDHGITFLDTCAFEVVDEIHN